MAAAKRGHSSTEDVQPREIYIFTEFCSPYKDTTNPFEVPENFCGWVTVQP